MLETFAAAVIAEREKEFVTPVVSRTEECICFPNEILQSGQCLRLHLKRRIRIAGHINLMHDALLGERNLAKVRTDDCRGIYELSEGDGFELKFVLVLT